MTYIAIIISILLIGFFYTKVKNKSSNEGFNYTNIGAQEAKSKIKSEKLKIIDVRTPPEVSSGKIKGSKNINLNSASFKKEIGQLDKEAAYLIYCRSGRRSAYACKIMNGLGFEHVYNLTGGFNTWK